MHEGRGDSDSARFCTELIRPHLGQVSGTVLGLWGSSLSVRTLTATSHDGRSTSIKDLHCANRRKPF